VRFNVTVLINKLEIRDVDRENVQNNHRKDSSNLISTFELLINILYEWFESDKNKINKRINVRI